MPFPDPGVPFIRRQFLNTCGVGLGSAALAHLLANDSQAATNPMAPRQPHFPAQAKNVIYLFMAGGPSQLELFSDKPELRKYSGQTPPETFTKGRRFAFLKPDAKLLGAKEQFGKYGQCGMELSTLLPHHQKIVDEVCWLRAVKTDVFNHGPAKMFMNSGFQAPGRPAFGSWVTYGLGSESDSLPGFVVLQSGPRGPRGGNTLWSSGFLPTSYQGVPFRGQGSPILHLDSPPGITADGQRDFIDTLAQLNQQRVQKVHDPEIETRIAAYETAFRMQSSAPELISLDGETSETFELYGAEPGKPSYAMNCLLARRMIERGVRFVQLYHTDWDHHGGDGADLEKALKKTTQETDQASAALVLDLKRRGLLNDTLVIWGGEFGRTPMGEERGTMGRDHHVDAFTMWLAGGGVKSGHIHGATDEMGFGAIEGQVHVHDLHATLLHLLGFDHERLTTRFQGRDFRLTDIHGKLVPEIMA
jgi:hypothetical protein